MTDHKFDFPPLLPWRWIPVLALIILALLWILVAGLIDGLMWLIDRERKVWSGDAA